MSWLAGLEEERLEDWGHGDLGERHVGGHMAWRQSVKIFLLHINTHHGRGTEQQNRLLKSAKFSLHLLQGWHTCMKCVAMISEMEFYMSSTALKKADWADNSCPQYQWQRQRMSHKYSTIPWEDQCLLGGMLTIFEPSYPGRSSNSILQEGHISQVWVVCSSCLEGFSQHHSHGAYRVFSP